MPASEKLMIERIRRAAQAGRSGRGIGDDCAVLSIPRGHEALITTDFSLEGVHFRREWHPPEAVGHRLEVVEESPQSGKGRSRGAHALTFVPAGTTWSSSTM